MLNITCQGISHARQFLFSHVENVDIACHFKKVSFEHDRFKYLEPLSLPGPGLI